MLIRRQLGVLLLAIALQSPGGRFVYGSGAEGVAVSDHSAPSIGELEAKIVHLRSQGRIGEAIAVARLILDRLAVEENESPFALDDARGCLITLLRIADFSEFDRCTLGEADAAAGYGPMSIAEVDAQVALRSRLLGKFHFETLTWMVQAARIRVELRLVSDAELMYRRALEGFRATLGDDHPTTLWNQSRLAMILHFEGDYAEAARLFRLVVDSRRRVLGRDHEDTRAAEVNLAGMLFELGRYQESGALYRSLFEWFREQFGDEHYITLNCMGGLGCSLRETGGLDEAERLLRRRIEIDRKHQNGQTNDIEALLSLALVLRDKGALRDAEGVCREALAVHERIKHVEDPKLLNILNALAELVQAQGRYADAEAIWRRSATSYENLRGVFSYAGFERMHFSADASPLLRFAACLARNGKPEEAWRQLERGLARGLMDVIDVSTADGRPAMTDREQIERRRLLAALSASDERVAVLHGVRPIDENSLSEAFRERSVRRADLIALEKRMAERYGNAVAAPYDLARIQSRLRPDAAMVAWVDFSPTPGASDIAGDHWACVIRHSGGPTWVRLHGVGVDGRWTDRDELLAREVADRLSQLPTSRVNPDEELAALARQRLNPIASDLTDVRHLVVLPIGAMSRVPVQALTDCYTVSYAPSGTLYAWLSEANSRAMKADRGLSLLALGDPNYADSAGSDFRSIPGTGYEVKAIAELFKSWAATEGEAQIAAPHRDRVAPRLLLNDEATESHVQSLAVANELRRYSHIHLSAHGVLDDVAPWRTALILAAPRRSVGVENALHDVPFYDGRLTAQQIVRTWRLDADLVTLSGCETGLGKSEGGEGIVGFSHALFASGARSLVLSLWKVDDLATTLLMRRFYENLIGAFSGERAIGGTFYSRGNPMPKAVALYEAKRWLRTNTPSQNQIVLKEIGLDVGESNTALALARSGVRMTGERPQKRFDYSDPHYWAAFVLSGNPD